MIHIDDKALCCGCSACYAVCPHDAISMKPDALGLKYPCVDIEKCVECGLCKKVCAFTSEREKGLTPDFYAVRHKDISQVEGSTSGAAFVAFSDLILENGGVVYGAAYDGHFRVMHKRVSTVQDREALRRSKYVQSDMGNIFRQVRDDLRNGLTVLFCGTPCQVDGLKSYIGKKLSDKLILVDMVCHGVPAPGVWESYLGWQEARHGGKVLDVNFRDKSFGWRSHMESFVFDDGIVYDSSYTYLFYRHLSLRESCGICPYASRQRVSDLTIADYWRKDKTCPDFASDNKGCSLVLCSTQKGRSLFEAVSSSLYVEQADPDSCIQPNMIAPSRLNKDRRRFELDYIDKGIEYVMKIYGDLGWRYALKSSCESVYQFVRQSARKILGRR